MLQGEPNTTSPSAHADGPTVHHDAAEAVLRLKAALATLFRDVGVREPTAPALRKALAIDTKLSVQLATVLSSEDPLVGASKVPGSKSMTRLLSTAAEKGAGEPRVSKARAAFDAFEAVVARHASDRSAFDAMLGRSQSRTSGHVDLSHRRAAFRATAHVLGAQCDLRLRSLVVHYATPDGSPGDLLASALDLNLFRGVSRLRPGTPVCLLRNPGVQATNTSRVDGAYYTEYLAPAPSTPGSVAGLLPDFTSSPAPSVSLSDAADGARRTMLDPTPSLGRSGAVDLTFAQVERNFGRPFAPEPGLPWTSRVIARAPVLLPTRKLVVDVMIPKGSLGRASAWANVYGRFFELDPRRPETWAPEKLPFDDRVDHLGSDWHDLDPAGISDYPDVLSHALRHIGWHDRSFEIFRASFDYPVLYSSIHVPVGERRPGD